MRVSDDQEGITEDVLRLIKAAAANDGWTSLMAFDTWTVSKAIRLGLVRMHASSKPDAVAGMNLKLTIAGRREIAKRRESQEDSDDRD